MSSHNIDYYDIYRKDDETPGGKKLKKPKTSRQEIQKKAQTIPLNINNSLSYYLYWIFRFLWG